jgi:predicted phage terminase large subunit-like protein
MLIVDDPMPASKRKNLKHCEKIWDLYVDTLLSRLNDKANGKIVVISQRLCEADVVGHVVDSGYELLKLQSIADEPTTLHFPLSGQVWERPIGDVLNPALESHEVLTGIRAESEDTFQTQYQQNTKADGSGMIRYDLIGTYDKPLEDYKSIILSIDSAGSVGKNSSNWGLTVFGLHQINGLNNLDLLYSFAKKMEYPEGEKKIRELEELYNVTRLFIENKSTGIALIPTFKAEGKNVEIITPVKSKDDRAMSAAPFINSGRLRVPNDDLLPHTFSWMKYWKYEISGFPNAKTRDLLDSTTQVVNHFTNVKLNAAAFYRIK